MMAKRSQKPVILAMSRVYAPGYRAGGPVRSLTSLVDVLSDSFSWKILTTDRDLGARTPYLDVLPDRWSRVGNADVWYASDLLGLNSRVLQISRGVPHDLIYLNSFFDSRFSIVPILAMRMGWIAKKPVLLATRGEFSLGALELKKQKKRLYIALAKIGNLYDDVFWHASTALEAQDIERQFGVCRKRIFVASDIASPAVQYANVSRRRGGALRVCFLSRICRMKNLDFALRALSLTRESIVFDVYGPQEDRNYWTECQALIRQLPSNVLCRYEGAVAAEDVSRVLAGYDLFLLPTRGENFGHVIVEALGAGLPVLTSDRTPWRHLEERGVGWDLPFGKGDLQAFAEQIDTVARFSDMELDNWRVRARSLADTVVQDTRVVDENRIMFDNVIGAN